MKNHFLNRSASSLFRVTFGIVTTRKRMTAPLDADAWTEELQDFFADFDEFSERDLILDEAQSFNDVLVFDIAGVCSEITSDVTTALERSFAGQVTLGFTHDLSNSRRKNISVTVRRPSPKVMRVLRGIYEYHAREISAAWSWKVLIVCLLVALLLTGHAAYTLHEHLEARDKPLSVLSHFVVHNLARLWLFASSHTH